MLTATKKPPANMKVITVIDATVVAFFKSIRIAPTACPNPCTHTHTHTTMCFEMLKARQVMSLTFVESSACVPELL